MLPRSFYFLRHGETDWNKEGRLQGHVDIPLNETGRNQARLSIPILQKYPIDRIISSPLSRALETAQIVNELLQKPLIIDERLRERHFGLYEGKTGPEIDQWKAENPGLILPIDPETGLTSPPGGETYQQLRDRVFQLKNEILTMHQDESILFVAHGGVYQLLFSALAQKAGQQMTKSPNAKPFHFVRNGPLEWELLHLE